MIRGLLKNVSSKIKTNAMRCFNGPIIIIKVLDNDGSTIETSDSISFNVSTKSEKKHFSILMQFKEPGSIKKGIEKNKQ